MKYEILSMETLKKLQNEKRLSTRYKKLKQAYEEIIKELNEKDNFINEYEKWLEEHSIIDYNCRETIIHEQMALSTALSYFKDLQGKA